MLTAMMMKRTAYRLSSFSGPLLMVGLLVVCLAVGCGRGLDPRLSEADARMEAHPDSALAFLNKYRFAPDATEGDSAYYALLLTHARYKTFIDETDDSLISAATDYFLKHGDDEKASRALFLQGMILMNARQLGEAAVAFRKGLDVAREGKHYIWEGQCARGLCMLYGELHDGSAQVNYATQAYDAYLKTGDQDWISYSKLDLARALHNNLKYEESLSVIDELQKESLSDESEIFSEISQQQALSLFALGRFKKCIEAYSLSNELDSSILNSKDIRNLRIAVYEIYQDSVPMNLRWLLDRKEVRNFSEDSFDVLVRENRYKDAYESLVRYKNIQDSVLLVLFRNNVSSSVQRYEAVKETLYVQTIRTDRMIFYTIILNIIAFAIIIVWQFREQRFRLKYRRLKMEADIESIRSDLLSQMGKNIDVTKNSSKLSGSDKVKNYISIIRQRYAESNRLCDEYYQRASLSKKSEINIQDGIDEILKSFREKSSLTTIAEYVDEKSDGLYASFRKNFYDLSEENHTLFLYLILGLSPRSISVIIRQSVNTVYNRKSRLKARIEKNDRIDPDEYLKFF